MSSNQPLRPLRSDPLFKLLTRQFVEQFGLVATQTELQIRTRQSDLVLTVPPTASLKATILDFLLPTTVLEFKSENDRFEEREFIKNSVRLKTLFLQRRSEPLAGFLNLIVCARKPTSFLKLLEEQGIRLDEVPGRKWLRIGQVGLEQVAIVVCRDLPVQKEFYPWLTFAPVSSPRFGEFVEQLVKENNQEYLTLLKRLRPKEVAKMLTREDLKALMQTPEYEEAMSQPERELSTEEQAEFLLDDLQEDHPEKLQQVLEVLSVENRLQGLAPEERLQGLSEEERERLLQLLLAQRQPPTPS